MTKEIFNQENSDALSKPAPKNKTKLLETKHILRYFNFSKNSPFRDTSIGPIVKISSQLITRKDVSNNEVSCD